MNRAERRRQKKAGIKVQKEPTLNLKVSDFDHMVSHAEKSAKERATAAAIHEIDRQILEHDEAYSLDIDAMVLWALHVYLGFGKKRLERFYRDAFNDAVYASLVNLCVDICQRNGKSKLLWLGDKNKTLAYAPKSDEMVLTVHRWFANKSCPGDWLYNRLGNLAAEVTKRLTGGSTDTGKVDVPSDGKTLYRVQTGAFSKRSNADAWAAKLKTAGFDTYIVQMGNLYKVQVGAYSQKSNAENMMVKLKAAGYDAFITTKSGTAAGTAKKSAAEIAKEIYNGTCSDARWSSWGNGADRVNRLKQAGYDPSEVQSEVNKLF